MTYDNFFYFRKITVKSDIVTVILHSFSHQWLYSPLLGPGLFFSFVHRRYNSLRE
jgi:hypothetical protein